MRRLLANRPVRRLLFAVAALAAIDPFVDPLVNRLEQSRYESAQLFRFENSDLFSLAPLDAYLREHPRGARPRVAFLGDSVVWGYFVEPTQTLPAQFQRVDPSVRVFNLAINGMATPNAYLIAKSILDSVDLFYLGDVGGPVNPALAGLVPVDDRDMERFRLPRPDRVEAALERSVGFWRLYSQSYRLQSALFGTSTRLYLYLHKGDLVRRLRGVPAPNLTPAAIPDADRAAGRITVDDPRAPAMPSDERGIELNHRYQMLWDFAHMVAGRHKRAVLIEFAGHSTAISPADRADLNALFSPYVNFVKLTVPRDLTVDEVHLSPLGCAAVAQVLARVTPAGGQP